MSTLNKKINKYHFPKLINLSKYKDKRGNLSRVFCYEEFCKKGIDFTIKQINHVAVSKKGTIKGMHLQIKPFAEIKTVNVIRGEIIDIIIDVRKNSKNFLDYQSHILNSKENKCLFIPKGFAHGFQTLSNDCEIIYSHSEVYKPNKELSINPFDTKIGIKWPIKVSNISSKDKNTKFIYNDFKGILI
jgi:dTDP-4-dehydrorhamnose 3,5-epimerase